MVTMPNGARFDMEWKRVVYTNGGHSVILVIVPMRRGPDIVFISDHVRWAWGQTAFSEQERLKIIDLLKQVAWKRDLRIMETREEPNIDGDMEPVRGTLESTTGFREMTALHLFDPGVTLTNAQVKNIFCILERRFAEGARGRVTIPKDYVIKGSILDTVSIPALRKNNKVNLHMI